jgi:hypothetical protein
MLKFHARKQKAQSAQQFTSSSLNYSNLFGSQSGTHNIPGGSGWNQGANTDSSDAFERFDYLSKLKEENEVLVNLLKEIQLNKGELTKRMRELEMTRDAILSLRPSVTKNMIDTYLVETCPLASKNRPNLNLTTVQSVQAREVYDRMLGVTAVFRSNQAELQDFLMQHIVTASDHFINDEFAQCLQEVERMENVMRAGPRNVASAQELVQHLEDTIFQATADQFTELLREEVSKRKPFDGHDSGFGEYKAEPHHGNQATATLLAQKQTEIVDLQSQNEELRQTVTDLQDKLAQLKIPATTAPVSAAPKSTATASAYNLDAFAALDEPTETVSAMPEVDDDEKLSSFRPSSWLTTLLQEKMLPYVQQIVDGHPMASALTTDATRMIGQQIAEEISKSTGLTLFIRLLKQQLSAKPSGNAEDQQALFVPVIESLLAGQLTETDANQVEFRTESNASSPSYGVEDDLFGMGNGTQHPSAAGGTVLLLPKTPVAYFQEMASPIVRLTVFHNEVACLSTMFLTYLRQRLHIVTSPRSPSVAFAANPSNTNSNAPSALSSMNLVRSAVPVKSVSPALTAVTAAGRFRQAGQNAAQNKANSPPPGGNRTSKSAASVSAEAAGITQSSATGWNDDFMMGGGVDGATGVAASEPYLYRTRSGDSLGHGGAANGSSGGQANLPRYMMPKNVAVTPGGAVLPSRNAGIAGADNNSRASGSRR